MKEKIEYKKEDLLNLENYKQNWIDKRNKSQLFDASSHENFVYYQESDPIVFEGNDYFSRVHPHQVVDTNVADEIDDSLRNKIRSVFQRKLDKEEANEKY